MKISSIKILFYCLIVTTLSCTKTDSDIQHRTFYMGFTTWPYDFTSQAVQSTYNQLQQHADLIAFHFDNGVPWNEALHNTGYPAEIINDLHFKKVNTLNNTKVYVSVSALNTTRTNAALYRNSMDNQPLPMHWDTMQFDNQERINAYINYCSLLIDSLKPAYFNYAIESNSKDWSAANFAKYKYFCSQVYTALKVKSASLPVFVSVMVDTDAKYYSNAAALMPFSDYIALSIYPYIFTGSTNYGNTDPDNFLEDWIRKMRQVAPDKKFGIAETGYIAEDLNLSDYGITKQGTPAWQSKYVTKLLSECNDLKADFLVYWEIRDYDLGWQYLQTIGQATQANGIWKDIGLQDGAGNSRPAMDVWQSWLSRKVMQ